MTQRTKPVNSDICWRAVICHLPELSRNLTLLEAAGYHLWKVLIEHSEYTILAYLPMDDRERLGLWPPVDREDRNPYVPEAALAGASESDGS